MSILLIGYSSPSSSSHLQHRLKDQRGITVVPPSVLEAVEEVPEIGLNEVQCEGVRCQVSGLSVKLFSQVFSVYFAPHTERIYYKMN